MPKTAALTLHVWQAHPKTPCDEHRRAGQPTHDAAYCLTTRNKRSRAVHCVCRAGALDAIDKLLGVKP